MARDGLGYYGWALWVIIRTFDFPHEAELARIQLDASGIEARLRDVETVSALSHLGPALGGVKLEVLEQDAELAYELLEADAAKPAPKLGPHRRAPELEDDSHDDSWDDEELEDDEAEDDPWEGADDPELSEELRLARREEALELPGDAAAARAYNAALLGLLLCPGIAHGYSFFLASEIREQKLELTARGESKLALAAVIDVVVAFAVIAMLISYLINL